ncbi:NADH dehydrogenase [ubiquinone] 1 beta subcomplex subunit 6 isoform X2 [Globicephala melas]|uniref:NADH dehydrogenase [ubiquinone] 1 beta subcomplex subunit 6 isoform X2 n=1 Tax=Globicephala melas TaxID=9731 RepID=UPI00122F90E5|nr:NADH dehydrogenase [ubiquinone] 1 beta subcomplex subunit 6 isoform X2 [Globicephala melas]XP_060157012.1 NADH dehydrogenase [ubiquinone] 1 beta subcomplex subunit 6 isoform X2 [Globicephala melas]
MSGYTSDEKLRLQQLRELRRRWLKDQELSPREPVLPPRRMWPMEQFWNKFLQDGASWKNVTKPYAVVERKPRIFPGDTILETGEVIPPMKEFPDQHH